MCSETLAWDALATLILYLIGLPVFLGQTASEPVRQVVDGEIWYRKWWVIGFLAVVTWLLAGIVLEFCAYSVLMLLLLLFLDIGFSLVGVLLVHVRSLIFILEQLTVWAFKKGVKIDITRYLSYLRLLGEEAKVGQSKGAVIRALGRVARKVMHLKSYDGNSLGELIGTMKDVLLKSSEIPLPTAFGIAVEELDRILHTYNEKYILSNQQTSDEQGSVAAVELGSGRESGEGDKISGEQDPITATKALSDIGSEALRHYPNTGLADAVLDTLQRHTWLGPRATQALVEIAATAVKYHHPEVTMSALRSIEQILYDEGIGGKNREMLYDYLSVIALMSSHCGITAKRFAERAWGEFCAGESPITCKHYAIGAYDHHAQSGRFALADAIHHTFIAPSSPLPQSPNPLIS